MDGDHKVRAGMESLTLASERHTLFGRRSHVMCDRRFATGMACVVIALGVFAPRACVALVLKQSGYSATLFKSLAPPTLDYGDLEVDPSGTVYVSGGVNGIQKITSGGVVTPWSAVESYDLTLAPAGDGYVAGRNSCKCIRAVQSSGVYTTLHQDSLGWSYVALTSSDTLYANVLSALYRIDRATGVPSPIVLGGPGPGGAGSYSGMTGGSDGKLYLLGRDGSPGRRLFRLDGNQFTVLGTLPHGGIYLAQGPAGIFYVSTTYESAGGALLSELWIVDTSLGTSSLLASSEDVFPTGFEGVAYDPNGKTIYLVEGRKIMAIKADSTPARPDSWGSVKARYRK